MPVLDIEELDRQQASEIKCQGPAWCGNCNATTNHRVGFDVGYGGVAAICSRCFTCNGVMQVEAVEQLIKQKKASNRKVQIAVTEELKHKFDSIPESERNIIKAIQDPKSKIIDITKKAKKA